MTIDWWHINNNDPGKSLWQAMADEFHAAHPNVTIKITVLENDTFKPKLQTEIQGGNVPDLFQSWGGGGMAEQVRGRSAEGHHRGRRQSWKDTINPGALGMYRYQGKQYGIPYDLGMVGIWYNKDLFQQAGISAPPATWRGPPGGGRQAQGQGHRAAGDRGQGQWPAMFWWAYLVAPGLRRTTLKATNDGDWNTDACKKAVKRSWSSTTSSRSRRASSRPN